MEKFEDCACQKVIDLRGKDRKSILLEFSLVRENCQALKEILIPDNIWPDYQKTILDDLDPAKHGYIAFLAFKFGSLKKITAPIHKYLLDSKTGKPKDKLKNSYKKDLIEFWMTEETIIERHRKSKIYIGKLTELLIAAWLQNRGWRIYNLEALCSEADIEAISPSNLEFSFEVKYIGEEDDKFLAMVESNLSEDEFKLLVDRLLGNGNEEKIKKLVDKSQSRTFDPYSGINYVIFRVFESFRQLKKIHSKRIIIISGVMTWNVIESPITEDWIDWRSPSFLAACSQWDKFLEENKRRYPDKFGNIEEELQSIHKSIDQLWIIRQGNEFDYSLERVIEFNR
jgi:hypothetical protein